MPDDTEREERITRLIQALKECDSRALSDHAPPGWVPSPGRDCTATMWRLRYIAHALLPAVEQMIDAAEREAIRRVADAYHRDHIAHAEEALEWLYDIANNSQPLPERTQP